MEYEDENFEDEVECRCGKCRECELWYAISHEKEDYSLLDQWVSKWELRKKPKVNRVAGVIPNHQLPPGCLSTYELTLTTTQDNPQEIREYLEKVVRSAIFGVLKWEACYELQENGMPHIHALLYSSKKHLDGTKIKSPKGPVKYPYIFNLKKVRNMDNYLNYIHKENGNPIIEKYCNEKGILQFFGNGLQQDVEKIEEIA